MEHNY